MKSLTNSGANWLLSNDRVRTFDNPLHLADLKSKRLRSLLEAHARRERPSVEVPFIQGAVFLSLPSLQVALDEHHLHWVFGPEPQEDGGQPGRLPGIWSGLLGRAPQDDRRRVTADISRALPRILAKVGVARSRRHHQVGSWQLDPRPFDVGPTWQDHLAQHAQFSHEHRRVRVYLVERSAAKAERASIERAARREMLALHGVTHPGIVRVDTMEPHEGGPALIFRHDPRPGELGAVDPRTDRTGIALDERRMVQLAAVASRTAAASLKLAEFTRRAWDNLRPASLALPDRRIPLLLVDAAPLARYRGMHLLEELTETARAGAGPVWLLCPDGGPDAGTTPGRRGGARCPRTSASCCRRPGSATSTAAARSRPANDGPISYSVVTESAAIRGGRGGGAG